MKTTTPAPARLGDLFRDGHAPTVIVLSGGFLLAAITMYVTSALMPSIVGEIGGETLYALPTTVYVVVSVIGVMSVSQLLQRLGARRAYLVAFVAFIVGSLVCACTPSIAVLLVGRAIVGFGGGLLSGLGYAVIRSALPSTLWSPATGLISAMFGIGTLVGPIVGGAFAEANAWRIAFGVIAATGAVLAALALTAVRSAGRDAAATEPLPMLAVVLLAAAVGVLSSASVVDGPMKLALIGVGLVLVAGFLARDRAARSAVLPRSTYTGGSAMKWLLLANACITVGVVSEIFTPLFGQRLAGLSPLVAGFFAAAVSLGWSVAGLFGSRAADPRWRARLSILGPLVLTAGLLVTALTQRTDASALLATVWFVALVVAGGGIGLSFPHISYATFSAAPEHEAAKAGAAIPMVGLIGQSFGSAAGGILVNLGLPNLPLGAAHLFIGLAVLTALGALSAVVAVRRGAFRG